MQLWEEWCFSDYIKHQRTQRTRNRHEGQHVNNGSDMAELSKCPYCMLKKRLTVL